MNMDSMMDITPDTKIGPLLENRPELESVLMEISPKYTALKNPVLRRTVAKVATLRQVARVGDVPIGELIRKLREAVGLDATPVDENRPDGAQPEWADRDEPVAELDIRPWLEAGEQPLERVMKRLNELNGGDILAVRAPFEPAPLMDMARQRGLEVMVHHTDCDDVQVWFYRP